MANACLSVFLSLMRKCRALSHFTTLVKAIRQFSSPEETHLILLSCLLRCFSHAG